MLEGEFYRGMVEHLLSPHYFVGLVVEGGKLLDSCLGLLLFGEIRVTPYV